MYEYKQVGFWENLIRLLNMQEYKLSKKQENIEVIIYSVISFFIPLVFKQPQMIVGAVVNAMLILAALNIKGWKIFPMLALPSIAVAAGGYLFGGFALYFVYLIPFIWIGNSILVLTFKYLKLQKNNNFLFTLGAGAIAKTGFLFGITSVLFYFSIVPAMFLTAMGSIQLMTALTGGILVFGVQNLKKKVFPQSQN